MGNSGNLTPYFTIERADEFIEYLAIVFGASITRINRHDNGAVQHARLTIGDSLIMLNEANEDYPVNNAQMHLYVGSVQKTYKLAMQYGASDLMQPMRRPHGDVMAGFKDPFGNTWWVAEKNN